MLTYITILRYYRLDNVTNDIVHKDPCLLY